MRSLVITKVLPVPANSGGRQRTLAVVRALAARGEVVLCALDDGNSDISELEAMGVDVRTSPRPTGPMAMARGLLHTRSGSSARFWTTDLAEEVMKAASTPFDVLVVEYVQTAAYAFSIRARTSVLATHNIESALLDSYSRILGPLPSIALRLEVAALRRLERRCMKAFDVVTVVSEGDRRRLPASGSEVLICPNGLEPGPELPSSAEPTAVFVASMD